MHTYEGVEFGMSTESKERVGAALFDAAFWRVTAALTCLVFSVGLMNQVVFPLFDPTFMFARDISVTANALFMVVVALLAVFKPRMLKLERVAEVAVAACLIIGAIALLPALSMSNAPLLVVSSCLFAVGRAGVTIMMGLAATGFSARKASACIGIAFTIRLALELLVWQAPVVAGVTLFLVLPLVAFALTVGIARPLVLEIAQSEAPADVAITQPTTFLPLASQFFICLMLFSMAFGFALRFGEVGGVPIANMIGVFPVALLTVYSLACKRSFSADLVVQVSVLLVAAGFFLATASPATSYVTANALLSTGNTLFEMVAWLVLIMLAGRNRKNALAVFAWGRGLGGFGTLVGAAIGMLSNMFVDVNPGLFVFVPCALMLVVVGYALIGMRSFSFSSAIEGVTETPSRSEMTAVSEASASEVSLSQKCRGVAEEYGLSPRELEVLELLAEGRDRAYIEEELVISRNTVKAHVKHIYAKLDIHSHQDLIALVHGD